MAQWQNIKCPCMWKKKMTRICKKRNQYPELCKAHERTEVSSRDAFIVDVALNDLEILSPSYNVDPSNNDAKENVWGQNHN